jgi:transketolase
LGNAINEALSDSERIAESISEIRKEGYDVFLVLEATIGFNKRSAEETSDPEDTELTPDLVEETEESVNWTAQDEKFLRALKITIDE